MTLPIWITYVLAVLLLMSSPGPSQLLMMSNSMANGFRRAIFTAIGDLNANALQMLAAGLGLGALILASETTFAVVKWGGVAYLVWMGVQKIRHAGAGALGESKPTSARKLYMPGFVTSAANPKAVIFFAALFPQFIDPNLAFWPKFLILSATYIVIDGCFLTLYGSSAAWVATRLTGAFRVWMDRVAGGVLISAAALLALKTVAVR